MPLKTWIDPGKLSKQQFSRFMDVQKMSGKCWICESQVRHSIQIQYIRWCDIVLRFSMPGSPSLYHNQNQCQLVIRFGYDFFQCAKREKFVEIVRKQSQISWKGKYFYKIKWEKHFAYSRWILPLNRRWN